MGVLTDVSVSVVRLEVIVPGPIVSLNRSYKPAVKRRRGATGTTTYASLVKTTAGATYYQRVALCTLRAKATCPAWPRDPWQVTAVRLSVYLYDTRVDVGAATKAVADAAERILYENDRVVHLGEQPKPTCDGSGTRLVAVYELLAFDPPAVATARRAAVLGERVRAAARRAAKRARARSPAAVAPYARGC